MPERSDMQPMIAGMALVTEQSTAGSIAAI
jgi:hypothetical protein